MEGRQATASPRAARASAGGNRRLGLWLGIGAVVVAIAGLAAWGFSGSSDYPEPSEYSLTPDPAHATGHPDIPAGAPRDGAAMIVDAPATAGEPALPAPAADTAPASADAASVAAAPSAATAASGAAARSPAPAARASRAATQSDAKSKGDENLLGTLLGIIKEEDKAKAKTKANAQPQSMDDLIAQIEADQRKRTEDERAAFERVASKKSASTESNIQAQLRACPSPASLKGVDCRRRICAAVSGKDPACPAM